MSSTVPTGFKETLSKYASPFDKEEVVDDDKELWLIRIPDNLSEEDLVNMKMKIPTQKASKKALAKYEKDNDKYALYKVPTKEEEEMEDNEAIDLGISGHEMVAFDCLLPSREDNGKLSFAPKKFDQYLILNQVVEISDSLTFAQSVLDTPVYKRDQPEGLKMRFMPYGYHSEQVTKDDIEMVSIKEEPVKQELNSEEDLKRKRTSEDDSETDKKKAKKEKKKDKKEKKDKKVKKEKA